MNAIIQIFVLTCLFCSTALGQQLEVVGDARIRGHLDITLMPDTLSVAIGRDAGVSLDPTTARGCTLLGVGAGKNTTTGFGNVYIGHRTGEGTTTGGANCMVGIEAGWQNQFGSGNSFFGALAGRFILGSDNSFFGSGAGLGAHPSVSGDQNCFFGVSAGQRIDGGSKNVLVGFGSGINLGAGAENVAIGFEACENLSTGSLNVVMGSKAGQGVSNSDQVTLIGAEANVLFYPLTNATALGYGAIVDASDKIRIGNDSVKTIEGAVPFTTTSDARLKENVSSVQLGLEFIADLHPVQYTRIQNSDRTMEMGLLAQELGEALQKHQAQNMGIVQQRSDGYYIVRYNDLLAPIIKSIQELKSENEELRRMLEQQEKRMAKLSQK